MRFADVAVDAPGAGHGRTFTYSIPAGMSVDAGDLVWVPFGPRTLQGIVFRLGPYSPVDETRDVIGRVDGGPFLSARQLAVAAWMSNHYRCGLYLASSQFLPPGASARLQSLVQLTEAGEKAPASLPPDQSRVLTLLKPGERIARSRLARRLGRNGQRTVDRLVRNGFLQLQSAWQAPQVKTRVRQVVRLAVDEAEAHEALQLLAGRRGRKRAELLAWLIKGSAAETRAELKRRFGASAVNALLETGLARLEQVHHERDPLEGIIFDPDTAHEPAPAQAGAVACITEALRSDPENGRDSGSHKRFLLLGVTGSGKTEVYLQAVARCIEMGRQALVLVPEISLTPQTLARLAGRFPGRVAVLHSGLSDGERFDQWWRIARGDVPIVLGARGAIFAPVSRLGLVVIDEEHEWTYKQQENAPRFHAGAVAERLCAETGAVLVLGSATPDIVNFRRTERGHYRLLSLPARISFPPGPAATAAGQAPVHIVDIRAELRDGHIGMFSRPLQAAMTRSFSEGGKVILFLNRRGSAAFVQCRDCGALRHCRQCDVSMAYHKGETPGAADALVCHYCNYRVSPDRACPACGGRQVRRYGPGTQAVIEEVHKLFGDVGALRWDRDVASTARAHMDIMDRFANGAARVLVGTQMVAKGLDVPDVTLVGVISADTGLAIPDFRAGERAFQLLAQVAGRAGRGPAGGQVVIQTMQPEHYAVLAAASQDYEAFYRTEMDLRARFANPPFTRLVKLTYSSADASEAEETARQAAAAFTRQRQATGDTGVMVIGPTPTYPLRIRGVARWRIILKGADPGALLDAVRLPDGWAVDVDPVSVG